MSVLSSQHLHDEEAAFDLVESALWPDGAVCPHCGGVDRITTVEANPQTRIRRGLHRCGNCRKQFTVKVGTIFQSSKVKMHLWVQAIVLMTASKEGISVHRLHQVLGVTYKTAWFMQHRIREAMRDSDPAPFGPDGGVVEVDDAFIGNDRTRKPKSEEKGRGYPHKRKVLSLVDRETGRARNFIVDGLKQETLLPVLRDSIVTEATVYTHEGNQNGGLGDEFDVHDSVNHRADEYGSCDVYTDTDEGCFSKRKRGLGSVYQKCTQTYLHRHDGAFALHYDNRVANSVNDHARARLAVQGASGKQFACRDSCPAQAPL